MPPAPDAGMWLRRGDIIRDELITGIEQWTNAVLVNKEMAQKLARGETPLMDEEENK